MIEDLPKFDDLMLPVLKVFGDNNIHTRKEIQEHIYAMFTPEQLSILVPSGKRRVIPDRTGWAVQYLRFANALESVSRGEYRITENGRKLLNSGLDKISVKELEWFPEFNIWRNREKNENESIQIVENVTPDDAIRNIIDDNNKYLKKQILEKIMQNDPYFFESLVLDLLSKMGYGRAYETPKTHDNGFDGIIYQDRLGIDRIYTQAKRYNEDHIVQQPDIDKFIGTLHKTVTRSNKGIFITTSDFSKGAREGAMNDSTTNIVLINGDQLSDLMIEYGVGVNTKEEFSLREIDEEYFE